MTSKTRNRKGERNPRDEYGVIVTLEHRESRERYTVTQPGYVQEALARAVAPFDSSWLVLSVSTPRTVLADVKGRAIAAGATSSKDGQFSRSAAAYPEGNLLSRIGRKDLM